MTNAGVAPITPVRICVSAINFLVGFLFLTRSPLTRKGTTSSIIFSLPSFLVAGLTFKLSPPTDMWPVYAEILFILGTLFTITSFIYLGHNFAVLPGVRGIVTHEPYHLIRHPAYVGELFLVTSCFIANPTLVSVWPFLAALPCIMMRIKAEEKLLKTEKTYRDYADKTVYRLLPGIW